MSRRDVAVEHGPCHAEDGENPGKAREDMRQEGGIAATCGAGDVPVRGDERTSDDGD